MTYIFGSEQPQTALVVLLFLITLPACWTDLRTRRVPNSLSCGGVLLAIGVGIYVDVDGQVVRMLQAVAMVAFTLGVASFVTAGIGMGDVKLLAFIALCIGQLVFVTLLLACFLAVLVALPTIFGRGLDGGRKANFAFAPFLSAGAALSVSAAFAF